MNKEHRTYSRMKLIGMATVCLSFCLSQGCSGNSWTSSNIEESKRIGDHIAKAVEKFREGTGSLPGTLDELIPGYIDTIRQPTAGTREWIYNTKGDSFSLSFGCGTDHYPNCCLSWTPRGSNWILDH